MAFLVDKLFWPQQQSLNDVFHHGTHMDSSDVIGESFALLRAWGKLNPEINHPKSKGSSLNESIRLFPELLSNTVASPDWSDWFWRVDFPSSLVIGGDFPVFRFLVPLLHLVVTSPSWYSCWFAMFLLLRPLCHWHAVVTVCCSFHFVIWIPKARKEKKTKKKRKTKKIGDNKNRVYEEQ